MAGKKCEESSPSVVCVPSFQLAVNAINVVDNYYIRFLRQHSERTDVMIRRLIFQRATIERERERARKEEVLMYRIER